MCSPCLGEAPSTAVRIRMICGGRSTSDLLHGFRKKMVLGAPSPPTPVTSRVWGSCSSSSPACTSSRGRLSPSSSPSLLLPSSSPSLLSFLLFFLAHVNEKWGGREMEGWCVGVGEVVTCGPRGGVVLPTQHNTCMGQVLVHFIGQSAECVGRPGGVPDR